MNDLPLVSISCITYNHASYIKECIDGFLMQKTNFNFEILIHDDHSTDGTEEIIKEYAKQYPDIIKPLFEKENQYSLGKPTGSVVWNLPRASGKYIAMCEGDDYWIDPYKLQKQVDFLESHPDYGMCYTKVKRFVQKNNKFIDEWGGPNEKLEDLLERNTVPTLTAVIRSEIYSSYSKELKKENKNWLMGDYPIWLYSSIKSKIHYLDEITGVYRICTESASHSKSLIKTYTFRCNFFQIKDQIMKKLKVTLNESEYNKIMKAKYFELLPLALILNDTKCIDSAKQFYSKNPKGFREFMILNLSYMTKILLKIKYILKGYKI